MFKRFKRQVPSSEHDDGGSIAHEDVSEYWSRHNVTSHHKFASAQDSIEYFKWRSDQYYPYLKLMPVKGHDGKVILDYGCGPGHDLVGFGLYSRPARLIGIDVSAPSLSETRSRLALHGLNAELLQIQPGDAALPFESGTMDYVHCSGVLHHVRNPEGVLKEFRRILKPGGEIRVMVYNKDSIWINLYVAYQKMILEGKYAGMCLADAFSHTTDGEDCPISRYYAKDEFLQLADKVALVGRFLGAAISMHEASIFTQLRYQAIQDRRMPSQHREWLLALTVDSTGFPKYEETFAGIDACFSLVKSTGDDFDRIA